MNSSIPLLAGLLMATIFVAGAVAFELGQGPEAQEALHWDSVPSEPDLPIEQIIAEAVINPVHPGAEQTDDRPVIVLVMDDAGIDPDLTREAIDLGIPLTLAFLPYAEETPTLARDAQASGRDIFLHLPMEPVGFADPGPGALTRHLSTQEIALRSRQAWAAVPGAIGFNNHMGSAFTADASAIRAALESLAAPDRIFLDSLTSGRSRAGRIARELGYISLRRDVFIDHDPDGVTHGLDQMADWARREGNVIAIGHPRLGTLSALREWLANPQNQDVRFVTISEYLLDADSFVSDETMSLLGRPE